MVDSEAWKTWAVPWKLPWMLDGHAAIPARRSGSTPAASPSETPGAEVEGNGDGGELALMVDGKIGVAGAEFGDSWRAGPCGPVVELT